MPTVLVVAQKGGVGKSFLADELAYSLDRTQTPYTFYDLDGQGGTDHETVEREDAVVTIVDTPGAMTSEMPDWIRGADIIVIPVRASMKDQPPFERTRQAVHTYAPGKPVYIVVNQWNRFTSNRDFTDWLQETRHPNETLTAIPAGEAVPRAGMARMSVTQFNKRSAVSQRLRDFTNMIRREAGIAEEDSLEPSAKPSK